MTAGGKGWVEYRAGGTDPNRFIENMNAICELIGGMCYEAMFTGGKWYVRRVE